ncbi:FecR family protein [Chitinophaga costaii]|uniref:FecR family protein n=1 Tax=Chitinophaga costaii TaxID=1335309 RepID=A0A1C4FML8_9BACT|nr:FecR domain-containing protein [Chitinophaga costaii]PUZ29930.1 DUF4974 domain-containing protein [Chitinophaga costaii]SCC57229.1 FecR family protein [Chitinophaga costaii]
MDKEEFLALAMKVFSGNHSPEEEALLQSTLREQPAYFPLYQQMQRYWNSSRPQASIQVEKRLQQTWDKINVATAAATPPRRYSTLRKWSAIAACLAVTAGSGWLLHRHLTSQPTRLLVEKHNPKGVRSNITLSDGTVVWLNANSTLRYSNVFPTNERVVYLEGEAFFTVAPQPNRPFRVQVPHGSIHVLGTAFNINSYAATGTLQTAVESGKVAFIPHYKTNQVADTFYLSRAQKAVFHLSTNQVNVQTVNTAEDKAWINGTLIFHGNNLAEIATILDLTYGKPVRFSSEKVKAYRYTGIFNNTAEEILHILSKTKHFNYSISDSLITIGE